MAPSRVRSSQNQWAVTSIKLPRKLKERMRKLVEKTDDTVHAFMLKAIESHTEIMELQAQHLREAEATYEATLAGGLVHEAEDVRAYLRQRRVGGKETPIPEGKPWQG